MNRISRIIEIVFVIFLIVFVMIWSINIISQQLQFINSCEKGCLAEDKIYSVEFKSRPWNNLNGICYCKELKFVKLEPVA